MIEGVPAHVPEMLQVVPAQLHVQEVLVVVQTQVFRSVGVLPLEVAEACGFGVLQSELVGGCQHQICQLLDLHVVHHLPIPQQARMRLFHLRQHTRVIIPTQLLELFALTHHYLLKVCIEALDVLRQNEASQQVHRPVLVVCLRLQLLVNLVNVFDRICHQMLLAVAADFRQVENVKKLKGIQNNFAVLNYGGIAASEPNIASVVGTNEIQHDFRINVQEQCVLSELHLLAAHQRQNLFEEPEHRNQRRVAHDMSFDRTRRIFLRVIQIFEDAVNFGSFRRR